MNTCRHVQKIRLSSEHSVLNSQKWKCVNCGSLENIWACLSCSYVACGKYLDEHIKLHYETQKHPVSINVWEKYVYCYDCDDYVLNDNAAGDIKILRNCLQAISSQHQKQPLNSSSDCKTSPERGVLSCRRSSRVQKSSTNSIVSMLQINPGSLLDGNEEVAYTELWFRRYYLLAHFFNKWKMRSTNIQTNSFAGENEDLNERIRNESLGKRLRSSSLDPPSKRRKHIIPGAVGLQNLGNTCYMNSILQVLKHLSQFSKVFLEEGNGKSLTKVNKPKPQSESPSARAEEKHQVVLVPPSPISDPCDQPEQTSEVPTSNPPFPSCDSSSSTDGKSLVSTADSTSTRGTERCHDKSKCGSKPVEGYKIPPPVGRSSRTRKKVPTKLSLSHELNSLLQIMWSGKMTLVSPHKMLYAVWNIIPFFRGYSQQDAQEFLSEFLDKVQSEMDVENIKNSANGLRQVDSIISVEQEVKRGEQKIGEDIVTQLFQGELISQVTCLTCGYESNRREAFMDLSLEFPLRFHRKTGSKKSNSFCRLEEMLGQFMQAEKLDGKIYACEECNKTSSKSEQTIYSEAEKKFYVSKLPNVLRLHLKRFMWSGRSSRGKITVNVAFPQHLNISEFCHPEVPTENSIYNLSAVVMHHGRGFGSGHYTAYCWNNDADSWLHCNDAKMQKASMDDVQKAQAYILVYTKVLPLPPSMDPQCTGMKAESGRAQTVAIAKSAIPKFADATRRLRIENLGFYSIKRTKTTIW